MTRLLIGLFSLMICISCSKLSSDEKQVLKRGRQLLVRESHFRIDANSDLLKSLVETITCGGGYANTKEEEFINKVKISHRRTEQILKFILQLETSPSLTIPKDSLLELKQAISDLVTSYEDLINFFPYVRKDNPKLIDELDYLKSILKSLNNSSSYHLQYLPSMKAFILLTEYEILKGMGSYFSCCDLKFSNPYPIAIPEANNVFEGDIYRAKIIFGEHSYLKHEVIINDEKQIPQENGTYYKFKTPACNSTTETCKNSWDGVVKFKNKIGEDSLVRIHQDYFIIKPCR